MGIETAEGVRSAMARVLKVGLDQLGDTATLEALGADSLHVPELAMELEGAFAGIVVQDEDVSTATVAAIVAMVSTKLEALPPGHIAFFRAVPRGAGPRPTPFGTATA